MGTGIRNLEPKLFFEIFDDLVVIPRGSKKEEKAIQYCLDWAAKHGFETKQSAAGSIVIAVPATPGHENAPGIVVQGHLDIVWEKTPDNTIDFETDPIPAFVDGEFIKTRGTTLGADNGIGVAAGMAAAIDPDGVHGPLELLLTTDEETGMGGAFGLETDLVNGSIMLNLDSEEEGTMYVGCAGGGDTSITMKTTTIPKPEGSKPVKLTVSGLRGGHSGLDINGGRGNSVRLIARMATQLEPRNPPMIYKISGGTKRNAIPRDAEAYIFLPEDRIPALQTAVAKLQDTVRIEIGHSDGGVTLGMEAVNCEGTCNAIKESKQIWNMLLALPHGPIRMSQAIEGLVETSSNLAMVSTFDDRVEILCNTRSMVGSAIEAVRFRILAVAELAGADCVLNNAYPGWRPDMDSRILKTAKELWKERTGDEPHVTAIHAGLECGVIGEKYPDMDMISFGPDITGAHSPEETLSVPSSQRFYDYLKALLKKLA